MDKIKFAKVKENAIIPSKKVEDAGYDIYACWDNMKKKDAIIAPLTTKLIPTGIACALPTKYYFQVEERGSTGSKGIKKSAGVIDSGYRGEIFIAITNSTNNFLVFDDKDNYLADAKKELENYKDISSKRDKFTEKDFDYLFTVAQDFYRTEFPESQKKSIVFKFLDMMCSEDTQKEIENSINSSIFYPKTKAIAQLVLHEVPVVEVEEISYEDLKNIDSERGAGKLGSSGK